MAHRNAGVRRLPGAIAFTFAFALAVLAARPDAAVAQRAPELRSPRACSDARAVRTWCVWPAEAYRTSPSAGSNSSAAPAQPLHPEDAVADVRERRVGCGREAEA